MSNDVNRHLAPSRFSLRYAVALAGALLGLGLFGAGCVAQPQTGEEEAISASVAEVPKQDESIKQCYNGVRCGPLQFDPDLGYYAVCCPLGHCAIDEYGDGYCF